MLTDCLGIHFILLQVNILIYGVEIDGLLHLTFILN